MSKDGIDAIAICSLREAMIFASILSKMSIPAIHSAAALLKLCQITFNGSNVLFIRAILAKKYSLPRRVIVALIEYFQSFMEETRALPVLWHQALLIFTQYYKTALDENQIETVRAIIKTLKHHLISIEIRRELDSLRYITKT